MLCCYPTCHLIVTCLCYYKRSLTALRNHQILAWPLPTSIFGYSSGTTFLHGSSRYSLRQCMPAGEVMVACLSRPGDSAALTRSAMAARKTYRKVGQD